MLHSFKKQLGHVAIVAAATLMLGGPAQAADLGGDCCADLEERVAVLEATAARKGNRKMSLTVSGWVSAMIMAWDDGAESDTYVVHDSTDEATNIALTGSAKINSDLTAGYHLRFYFDQANAFLVTQNNDDAGLGINVQYNYWYLKSKSLGTLSVGQQSGAGDNVAIGTDFTGTLFHANNVTFEGVTFNLRPEGGTGLTAGNWSNLLHCSINQFGIAMDCSGERTNAVRYDTPTFGGFSFSGSWGEDDRYDLTGRYTNEFGGFKLSTAVGYSWADGPNANTLNSVGVFNPTNAQYLQVGVTLKHLESGLWAHGSYGDEETDSSTIADGDAFYVKLGWSPKLNSLGRTHLYGEYRENNDTFGAIAQDGASTCTALGGVGGTLGAACAVDPATNITGSKVTGYGLGIVQEIDAASMNIWAKWRHYEAEVDFVQTNGTAGTQDYEDLDLFMVGAFLFF